jgi:hypothetical protein
MLTGMDLQRFSSASTCVTIAVCVTFDVNILSTVGTIDPEIFLDELNQTAVNPELPSG